MPSPASIRPKSIRILLVDPEEVARVGIRTWLESDPAFRIVAESASPHDAVALATRHTVQVVIMEPCFPMGDAIETCQTLLERLPQLAIVFLSSRWEDRLILRAIEAGAVGCLTKNVDRQRLVEAVRLAAAGQPVIDPALLARATAWRDHRRAIEKDVPLSTLSARERQLLPLISEGQTNKEIAATLSLSEKTVRNYLANLYEKLQVSRRAQVAAFYASHAGALNGVDSSRREQVQDPESFG